MDGERIGKNKRKEVQTSKYKTNPDNIMKGEHSRK